MADTPSKPPTSGFRVRPRFEQEVDYPEADARRKITHHFEQDAESFEVRSMDEFVVIHMAEHLRKRWSPRLQISLLAIGEAKSKITGVYGPAHEVWAQYIFGYIMAGVVAMFSGIYGGVQLFLGDEPWALWITGSMFVIGGLLYLGAQFGQKLGAWQTFQLHQAYQTAMGDEATDIGDETAGAGVDSGLGI